MIKAKLIPIKVFIRAVYEKISGERVKDANSNPLFDAKYYRAQLAKAPARHLTLLEHYVSVGANAGLDPSPFFCTKFYLDTYPDIKEAGVNPLLHYIQAGVHEGRDALPMGSIGSKRLARVFANKKDLNEFGLAYLAINLSLHKDFKAALKVLKSVKKSLPVTLYLKVCGFCFCLAGRFGAAEAVFAQLSQQAGVIDGKSFFANTLMHVDGLARELDDIALIHLIYLFSFKNGYLFSSAMLFELCVHFFEKGQIKFAKDLLLESNKNSQNTKALIMKMHSVKSHCVETGAMYHEIYPERPIDGVALKFIGGMPMLTSETGSLVAPPFYLAVVENCKAFNRCNIIVANDKVVLDGVDHDVFPRASLGEQYNGKVLLRYKDQALVRLANSKLTFIDKGLMMFGCQTHNYGHWFLEFLPRMIAFESELCPADFPIVIDPDMPQSHLDSLHLLNTSGKPIITLQKDQAVEFAKLGIAPVPAYFPLDISEGAFYDTVWPRDIFSQLKSRLLSGLARKGYNCSSGARRIFLSRRNYSISNNHYLRELVNEVEIERLLHSFGFITISPENLSFAEQIDVFQSASIVVGSCSSALTNAIFCNRGARIVGLMNDCPDFNFRGYASFIESGGAEIMFIQGRSLPNQNSVHRYHKSYTVSLKDVKKGLKWAGL